MCVCVVCFHLGLVLHPIIELHCQKNDRSLGKELV